MKQNRLERVIRGMEAMGLEQIIVSAPASVFYLTGTWVRPGERMLALYVHKSGEARLFANRLFARAHRTIALHARPPYAILPFASRLSYQEYNERACSRELRRRAR